MTGFHVYNYRRYCCYANAPQRLGEKINSGVNSELNEVQFNVFLYIAEQLKSSVELGRNFALQ